MAEPVRNPIESFMDYFDIVVATSDAMKELAYGVRYDVYCKEFGYEPIDAFPDHMERDNYDDYSTHCVVMHKHSGRAAGCIRLVNGGDKRRFPMEEFCKEAIKPEYLDTMASVRGSACEISRLAVSGDFRRRQGESETRFGQVEGLDVSKAERRTFALVAIAAYLGACAAADLTRKNVGFAMMEPFLPRLLSRSGIVFEEIGEAVEYHGLRAPYMIGIEQVIDNMVPELRGLYQRIYDSLEESRAFKAL